MGAQDDAEPQLAQTNNCFSGVRIGSNIDALERTGLRDFKHDLERVDGGGRVRVGIVISRGEAAREVAWVADVTPTPEAIVGDP